MQPFRIPADLIHPARQASRLSLSALAGLALVLLAGCESTDGGASVSGSVYYGVGFSDPWYYGGYYDDPDIIVTPPVEPPGGNSGLKPTHPIATPPSAPAVSPRPMPAIPSTPMPRVGGRR